MQPEQAAARPLRQGRRWPVGVERGDFSLPLRRSRVVEKRSRQRAVLPEERGHQSVLRLGTRSAPEHALAQDRRLRNTREGVHEAPPGHPRGAARNLRGHGPPGRGEVPAASRRHRGGAAAGAPVRAGLDTRARRGCATTGATTRSATLRRTTSTRAGQPRRTGPGVQAAGQDPARGRHRSDPRRGLQPHRRGQPSRADAVVQGHRQRRVLPAHARQAPLLHGLHRHRQHAEHAAPARAAADHGQPALLGHRDARRRLPLRSRGDAGARAARRRPAVGVLRPHSAGSRSSARSS